MPLLCLWMTEVGMAVAQCLPNEELASGADAVLYFTKSIGHQVSL